ncbi:uncharacterized protein [Rutidosis leptorrhynchoides]|uniref:uncharacterized protein n=1 Tax=Rutidosis leptorrhynchoides TaxID=125765 RepID=UPI003A98F5B9
MHLIEIPLIGKKFTRIRDNGMKLRKLDRFLVCENTMQSWGDISVVALDRNTSDHCPIVLRDKCIDFGLKPFKIFDIWFKTNEVEKVITEAWNIEVTGTRYDFVFRNILKNVKESLRSWSKTQYGNLDVELEEAKKLACDLKSKAEEITLSDSQREKWIKSRDLWLQKEREKTQMLRQKARIKLAIDGDENSKLFHSSTKRKKNKANI